VVTDKAELSISATNGLDCKLRFFRLGMTPGEALLSYPPHPYGEICAVQKRGWKTRKLQKALRWNRR
jgi:hypothetical protein